MAMKALITFEPVTFAVKPFTTDLGVKSYMVVDIKHNHPIGWFFHEEMANLAVLAFELVHAEVRGNTVAAANLRRAIDKVTKQ